MLRTSLLLIFSLFPAAASAQSAVSQFVGRPVQDVSIVIEKTAADEPGLRDLIEVQVGQPLSMDQVRESITHLYSLQRFQDIRVDATDAPGGGVHIRFDLVPIHVVEDIDFVGTLELSRGQLRDAINDRFGRTPPIGRADEVARTLRRLYHDEGYLSANVRTEAREEHDPDRTVLVFHVEAGPRAEVGNATIEGNPMSDVPALLRRLGATRGAPYRAPRIQERLDEYRTDLRRRGYYEASTSIRPTPAGGNVVDLLIAIEPGPSIALKFEGDRLSQDRLNELVTIRREASIDEDLLEDSETRLENYLRQQGYWKADVTVRQESANGGREVIFTINRGRQYRVAGPIEIQGATSVPVVELRALFTGLQPGATYHEADLSSAANAIQAYYRTRGYAAVEVKSASNELDPGRQGEGLIQPVIVVSEGIRTVIEAIRIAGNEALTEDQLRETIKTAPGSAYYLPALLADRDQIVIRYLDLGYASVVVDVQSTPAIDEAGRLNVTFAVTEGPQTIVDHILIVGNRKTNPAVITRELQLVEGQPLGVTARFESVRRLTQLGLFRRVRIDEVSHGITNRRDVVVTVEEAPATTIGYGGGVEFTTRLRATGPNGEAEEHLEFGPRGFFDIGRRNLGGKNRSVNLYTRVSLRPRDAPDNPELDGTGLEATDYRIVGIYREPRAFGLDDVILTGAIEQGDRASFNFKRQGLSAEIVRQIRPDIRVNGRYSFSTTRRFDERLDESDLAQIDRAFPQVRLSGFSGAIAKDTRDDILDPERGLFLSAEGSVAARVLGGEVGFMKTYLQGFFFRRLPGRRKLVLAGRASVGLADGFEREAPALDDGSSPIPGEIVILEDLPASERFFAGGDTTIRGFALDSVGTPATITANGFPTGGNAVLIMNGELRAAVWRDLGAAVFIDGGNVFRRVTDFDASQLRGSVGFGLRYDSPIGPVRVDLGFKLDRRVIGGQLERRTALHFSIGQAF
jgi:outer membrane protein insertion porin family